MARVPMSKQILGLVGWLAGQVIMDQGFGVLGNIFVGVVGALVGGLIFGALGAATGGDLVGSPITAVIGAVVLLFLAGLTRKKRWIFGFRNGDPEAGLGAETFRRPVVWKRLRNRPDTAQEDAPSRHTPPAPSSGRSFTTAATLGLLVFVMLLLWPLPLAAAPVAVRFNEGIVHGFLLLRTVDGGLIASGDLLQVARRGEVESRMVFRFKDGSLLDETVVFTQQRVFAMRSYHLVQRGPVFAEDTEISLERASGKYSVKTKSHKDGLEQAIDGTLDLPSDVYNGMIFTVVKNLPQGANATVHMVAFTPKPMLIELKLALAGEHKVLVGELTKTATHYVFKPHPGPWLEFFAKLLGRMPQDEHVWILTEEAPAFVKFEGALNPAGPVWQIELTSPRWPD